MNYLLSIRSLLFLIVVVVVVVFVVALTCSIHRPMVLSSTDRVAEPDRLLAPLRYTLLLESAL